MTTHIPPGIPLLSGPPPQPWPPEASACRKCGKEFHMFFNRQRKCMHCGYGYCSSCSDYQALMPRNAPLRGHDLAHVCAYCTDLLHITALSKSQLRALPLTKLRRYLDAYNIQIKDPVDKNDFVDAVFAARTPQGCLSPANEAYYRKHSVPKHNASSTYSSSAASRARNLFSRASSGTSYAQSSSGTDASSPNSGSTGSTTGNYTRTSFPRPDLDSSRETQAQGAPYTPYASRSASARGARTRTTSTPQHSGAPRSYASRPPTRPTSSYTSTSRPFNSSGAFPFARTTPRPAQRAPSPTPPPPSTLVTFTRSEVASLSIGMLKRILWDARVRLPPGVFEKSELVDRVWGK
ncbi:hypothetical protein F5I97DRAFT_1082937 [Phlebopus sp. FC_14]|nr:hypothetical protein F5I97DRAFT_1082937 [Phlebopus sp. FC_14]